MTAPLTTAPISPIPKPSWTSGSRQLRTANCLGSLSLVLPVWHHTPATMALPAVWLSHVPGESNGDCPATSCGNGWEFPHPLAQSTSTARPPSFPCQFHQWLMSLKLLRQEQLVHSVCLKMGRWDASKPIKCCRKWRQAAAEDYFLCFILSGQLFEFLQNIYFLYHLFAKYFGRNINHNEITNSKLHIYI